jgi:hypothetical protein
MTNEFDSVMEGRTDEELIAILNSPEGDYKPDAMDAAKKVVKARKLPEERVAAIKADQQQQKELADLKANEPLERYYKIIAFFVPMAIIPSSIGDEYERKASEWYGAKLYGYLFYGSILLLIILLRFVFKVNI